MHAGFTASLRKNVGRPVFGKRFLCHRRKPFSNFFFFQITMNKLYRPPRDNNWNMSTEKLYLPIKSFIQEIGKQCACALVSWSQVICNVLQWRQSVYDLPISAIILSIIIVLLYIILLYILYSPLLKKNASLHEWYLTLVQLGNLLFKK